MMTEDKDRLLDEWDAYCAGSSEHDKEHFSTLLIEGLDDAQLARFFASFPHADKMQERFRRVKSINQNTIEHQTKTIAEPDLDTLALKLRDGLAIIIEDAGDCELSQEIRCLPIDITDTKTVRTVVHDEDSLHFRIYEVIGDEISSRFQESHPAGLGLQEALYGMHHDYYLAWFCAAPMLGIDSRLDAYFDLWSVGGSFAVSDTALLISAS